MFNNPGFTMFPHCNIEENELRDYLPTVRPEQARASLRKTSPSFSDFVNFLSPATAESIDLMRQRATEEKLRHFGRVVRLYSPLYLSNHCVNRCEYCGFRSSHKAARRRLTVDDLCREAEIIRGYGVESLLLVSGEDPEWISMDYLVQAAERLKRTFSYLAIEIPPMSQAEYERLWRAGVHGVTIYQETYNRGLYEKLHRAGPKADYVKRLERVADAGRAGMHNLGLGVLLGLHDWRLEAVSLAAHGLWLRKRFWRSRIQFSFPRITPIAGGFEIPKPVNEMELEQMMLAFRIFFPESDLYLSTRESVEFRTRLAHSCASHLSAASKVVPGGYAESRDGDLGQFSLNDTRSVERIREDLKQMGLEPVFKDWDATLGMAS